MWSPQAEHLVTRLIAEQPAPDWARAKAERLGALFIGGSMWATYYLRPNGEVVIVGEDFDRPDVDSVYADRSHLAFVLVWGSRRYPALSELLPSRGPGTVDCWCRAVPLFAEGKCLCTDCGGLGWLPGNDAK